MRFIPQHVAFTLLLLTNPFLATAAPYATIYSDICFNSEAGDVIGERLVVIQLERTYLIFQRIGGDHYDDPIFTIATIRGSALRFHIPGTQGAAAEFQGVISANGITGSFSDGTLSNRGGTIFRLMKRETTAYSGC